MQTVYDRLSDLVKPILLGALLLAVEPAVTRGEEPPQEVSLRLGDYRYAGYRRGQAGGPVVLTLTRTDALTPHNFTLQDAAAGQLSYQYQRRHHGRRQFTPVKPGAYTFYCNKKLPFMKPS
jgi:hypothetical protein